jgi:Uma2 family endonuclease
MPAVSNAAVKPEIPVGLTYEEFLEWLDEDLSAEWVDGEIIVMSPAAYDHQDISDFLTVLMRIHVEDMGLGVVLSAPFQMKLSQRPSGREPDLLFVVNAQRDIVKKTHLDGAADLVVEIVSKESRGRDTVDKLEEYEEAGVREYWIVDPENEELIVHRQDAPGRYEAVRLKDGRYESTVLEGFWMEVAWLWLRPLPKIRAVLAAWAGE